MPKTPKSKYASRTLVALTAGGPVNTTLPANGTAAQSPASDNITNATAVVGDSGTATALTGGTAVAGEYGKAINERYGAAIVDYNGTAQGGAETLCFVQAGGLATTGDGGVAFAKMDGEAAVSGTGIAIAFQRSGAVVSATKGLIIIGYRDSVGSLSFTVGRIGKNGIKSGIRYTLDSNHKFVEAPPQRRKK